MSVTDGRQAETSCRCRHGDPQLVAAGGDEADAPGVRTAEHVGSAVGRRPLPLAGARGSVAGVWAPVYRGARLPREFLLAPGKNNYRARRLYCKYTAHSGFPCWIIPNPDL